MLDLYGSVLFMGEMPILDKVFDVHGLANILRGIKREAKAADATIYGFLEAASARPGQGVSTMFKFGRVYGLAEGGLAVLRIPYELVNPAKWTKTMLAGVEGDGKARNTVAAKRLFPSLDLRANPKCKVPSAGIVDAILIAEYGRRQQTRS